MSWLLQGNYWNLFLNMQDKPDHLFSDEILRFCENLVSAGFGQKTSDPGPGSAKNGFFASNYVVCANSRPKRRSGRPFRGQNCFSRQIRHYFDANSTLICRSHVEHKVP